MKNSEILSLCGTKLFFSYLINLVKFFCRFPFTNDESLSDNDIQSASDEEDTDTYSDSEQEQDDVNDNQITTSINSSGSSSTTILISDDEFSSDEEIYHEELDTSHIDGSVLNEEVFNILLNNLQVLQQTRNLILFIRNHQVTRDYLKQQKIINQLGGGLVLDMKIRWYSTQIMLERFLNHKDIVQMIASSPDRFKTSLNKKQQTKLKKLALTHNHWDLLDVISSLLEPFRHATVLLSGQTYPTLGLAYYIIKGLEYFLAIDDDELELTCAIKKSLRVQFKYHFDTNISNEQKQLTLVNCLETFYHTLIL